MKIIYDLKEPLSDLSFDDFQQLLARQILDGSISLSECIVRYATLRKCISEVGNILKSRVGKEEFFE